MIAPVHVLLVEDSPGDAELVRAYFRDEGVGPLDLRCVETIAAARVALQGPLPDAVLLDLQLPDSSGVDTLLQLRRLAPDVPVIVVSGALPVELRQSLMAIGATECIAKSDWTPQALTGAVRLAVKLRRALGTQRQLERLLSVMPDAVLVVDRAGVVRYVNDVALTLFGRTREGLVGEPVEFTIPDLELATTELLGASEPFLAEIRVSPVEWEGLAARLVVVRDTTAATRLNEQLVQAQKMEAVGLLAGGIAHDFNNLITVILAYGLSLRESIGHGDPRQDDVTHLLAAADRATSLTRQLLAVARRHPVRPQLLRLDVLLMGLEELMRRALSDRSTLALRVAQDCWPILADAGHIEQVLLNLVVNARDAMPHGGTLTLDIDNVEATPPSEGWAGGDAVRVRVGDNGEGIPPNVLPRLFQPFFTTKGVSKGTGLGLATCYGIIRQANGTISVDSTVGVGTVFTLLLPRAEEQGGETHEPPAPAAPERLEGHETVLIVEDNEALRRSMVRSLRRFGYSTLAATNGEEAQRVMEGHDGVIDLLLTDLMMPRMDGPALIATLRSSHPRLRVLGITGSFQEGDELTAQLPEEVEMLYKPFEPAMLMRAIRRVLSRDR